MQNGKRNYSTIIKDICAELDIQVESFSYDWVFKLEKDGSYNYIIGYQFGLNSASVNTICSDKSAASELMTSLSIPNVEHKFFMSPLYQEYTGSFGNWDTLTKYLNKHKQIVCKDNNGTSGTNVHLVNNYYELELATKKIFDSSRSMAVSPYYDIIAEYRVIVLHGQVLLVYSKERPYIIGNGINSIIELLLQQHNSSMLDVTVLKNLPELESNMVLNKDEKFYINWKHNLGLGSRAVVIPKCEIDREIYNIINDIVTKMNIRFASIDIVRCLDNYRVMEINSGVMMEHLSQQGTDLYEITKSIYKKAIKSMFDI